MASIYEQLQEGSEFFDLYREPTESDYEIAEANGISRKNVKQRLNYGFTIIEAITKPLGKNRKNLDAYERWRGICDANGIGFKTFESRLKQGKSEEVAATTKLHEPIKKVTREKRVSVLGLYNKWKQTIEENGIGYKTFKQRILRGWPEEIAATKKPRGFKSNW